MNVGLLLCGELGFEPGSAGETPVAVVAELCHRPAAAAAAVRQLDVSRIVLGLCRSRPSPELLGALRAAGIEPFGIESVMLAGYEREAPLLLAGAAAKLAQLPAGEYGRPTLAGGQVSRRALFSRSALLSQEPVAILNESACLGSTRCGLCSSRCAYGAIDASTPVPTLDTDACTACGACVGSCPAAALRLSGCSAAGFEAQLEPLLGRVAGIMFACRHAEALAPPGWALVEIPALGLLTPAWILQAWKRETPVRLAPCDQPCCAGSAEVEELAELVAAQAGLVRARPGAAQGPPVMPPDLSEPHGTVDALLALIPDGRSFAIDHDASPLGMLELDRDRCTLCGACAIACPTAALTLEQGDSALVLEHDPRRCIACDRCTAVCPEDALAVRPGIDVLRLRGGAVAATRADSERCLVCGERLPPETMRRRLRELLPAMAGAPLGLCTKCAHTAVPGRLRESTQSRVTRRH